MAKAKKTHYITVRYTGMTTIEYDRTQDPEWALVQYSRAKKEHPVAEVKIEIR